MIFLRIEFDEPGNDVELTTGDEVSMMQVLNAIEQCNGIFTIVGYGITYTIDMDKVSHWEPVAR